MPLSVARTSSDRARALRAPRLVAMTPIDPSTGLDIKWVREATPTYLPPPMLKSAQERTDQVNALIVTALSLACTAVAVFDLFLAALGS